MAESTRPTLHAARQAADGVLELSRVSRGSEGYRFPSDVYDVLGELGTLAAELPRALDHARQWLAGEVAAGRLGHDQYAVPEDVRTEVAAVIGHLRDGQALAEDLAAVVDQAREIASHLTGGQS